jgi:hypothetical protein
MKFKIKFKHLVEDIYETEIEADSKQEALELFEEDPFNGVEGDPIDVNGLSIDIINTEVINDDKEKPKDDNLIDEIAEDEDYDEEE